uniref:Uncharacterized protein n=1 Tax=Meloidogyne enterolobii TaxID=390850 RepID=A0A6V7VUQ5_MELEN|nr:unnamed protein product [Meloidogyne enterolobii]
MKFKHSHKNQLNSHKQKVQNWRHKKFTKRIKFCNLRFLYFSIFFNKIKHICKILKINF